MKLSFGCSDVVIMSFGCSDVVILSFGCADVSHVVVR